MKTPESTFRKNVYSTRALNYPHTKGQQLNCYTNHSDQQRVLSEKEKEQHPIISVEKSAQVRQTMEQWPLAERRQRGDSGAAEREEKKDLECM